MIIALHLILLILIAGSVVFYLCCAIAAARFFTTPKQEISRNFEPVSVMIPVCGVDDDYRENWERFRHEFDHFCRGRLQQTLLLAWKTTPDWNGRHTKIARFNHTLEWGNRNQKNFDFSVAFGSWYNLRLSWLKFSVR